MYQNLIKRWFVAQVKTFSNDLAFRNLQRQGFEVFAPKMKITTKENKKFINKDVLVFPGYIFVGVDPLNSNFAKINSTYGVLKLLSFNDKACEISNDIILALKNRYEEKIERTSKENLKKGDVIKFFNGPFVDLIAKIESIDFEKRVWLVLEVMGGNRRLKLQQNKDQRFVKI